MHLPYVASQLKNKIQVSGDQDSQVVTVNVTDKSQDKATKIANTTVKTFEKEIPEIMNVDNVKILSAAVTRTHPLLHQIQSLILRLVSDWHFCWNTLTIPSAWKKPLKNELGLPVLSIIPHMNGEDLPGKGVMPMQQSQT